MNLKNYSQVHRLTAIATFAALSLAGWSSDAKAQALYWNTTGATGLTWTGPNWATTDGGSTGTAWGANSDVVFGGSVPALATFATTTVGNITVNTDTTVTQSGTLSFKASGSTVDVAAGKTLNWITQKWSTSANQIVTKSGLGTWNIGAQNNALGVGSSFTLNGGTVIVSGDNSFGGVNSTLNINGGNIQQATGTRTYANAINIGGNFEQSGAGGTGTYSGTVSLGATTRTINNTQFGKRNYTGVISGVGGGLTITGAGTGETYIGNTGNTFSGAVTIVNAKTVWNGSGAFGNTTSITLDEKVSLASVDAGTGTFTVGVTSTFGDDKNIFLSANAGIGTVGNGVTTINGVIADKLGDVGKLTKSDTGTLILGGVNTYTGATRVSGGTLLVSNGGSIAQSLLTTVTTGATLTANGTVGAVAVNTGGTLNGAGTIGTTTVAGTLNPGNSPGVLNVNGNLTMASGGNMVWELFANSATQTTPAVFDQVVVNGDLAFDGSNGITLNFGTTSAGSDVAWSNSFWGSNRSFLIYDVAGSTGGFSNLSLLNTSFTDSTGAVLDPLKGRFSLGQSGSDVFLNYTAIPEPSTGSMLGFGFGGLVLTRLLRRKQS
jgi:autotransporter-associated beta strand protein